jgi:Na+-transporting methylmalonyl-CoA/oxaloacetate decarboxylase gamma subunit
MLIEELFKWKGLELEILEVRRETDFQLNTSDTSSLYSGISVCENLALSSWMKTIQHLHSQEGTKNLLKKQKRVKKQKHAMDGLEGETPQETIQNDREFEQVFSSAHTVYYHGNHKGWDDLSESGSEDELEEIPNAQTSKQPTRSISKSSLGPLGAPAQSQNKGVPVQTPVVDLESPYFKARRQLLHEKRIALSEESNFFSSVDIGSNVSDLAYWNNLIGWIHTVLNDKLSKPTSLVTDLTLLFFDEDFISLLNILQNFTKQKKSVRKIFFQFITAEAHHPRHRRDTILRTGDQDIRQRVLTIDQYLFNSMVLLQHALKQAVFGTNLKLELEQFFITSKFISSLMENNCNDFKDRLIGFTLGAAPVELSPNSHGKDQDAKGLKKNPPVNALGMIYEGLVLNPDITEPDICTEDRGDMVWYNISCLNLMAECMSGPFEKAQASLRAHTAQKASHLRLLRVCSRINTNINSSFFDLQEALVEFLAAIYEGVHQNTKKDLNGADSSPANMFKIIAQHLENLWLYSDVVIKGRSKIQNHADKAKSSASDWKSTEHFTDFIKSINNMVNKMPVPPKKENPMLDELVDYYTVHPSFSSHPSISIARKIYDIMTYAETAETRRFMRFLQTKREQMHELDTEDTKTKLLKAAQNVMSLEFLDAENPPSRQNSSAGGEGGGEVQMGTSQQNEEAFDQQKSQKKQIMLFKFLMEITGSVEVVVEKKHVRVQFPILPECKFINDEEVEQFIKGCSLEDPNTRLFELIDFVDEVLIDKQNDMMFYKIFPPLIYLTRRRTFKLMVLVIWMLSAAINLIWILASDIVEVDPPEVIFERTDTISILSSSAQLTIAILSVVIVVLSLLIFVIWLFTRWLNLVNIKELKLKKQKALNTEFQTRILRFKAFVIDSLIGQPLPMVLLLHILFVIFYYTVTDFFVCLHLLLFVYHSETTRYIMKSVTKDLKKIGITFLMIIFMVYCYSTIIGYHYADQFSESFNDINPCQTWASCLVYSFDYGLRLGGGIGDAMNLLPRENNYFTEKLVINLTFLLLIKLIASNIVLGIIIDTFSDLRDSQSARGKRTALIHRNTFGERMLHLWNREK